MAKLEDDAASIVRIDAHRRALRDLRGERPERDYDRFEQRSLPGAIAADEQRDVRVERARLLLLPVAPW